MQYYTILLGGGALVILSCLAAIFWFGGLLLPAIYRGGPFVPTSKRTTTNMLNLAQITNTDHVVDLGSGDGRLLFGSVALGAASAQGYEIHPGLVWFARWKTKWKHLQSKITIHQKTFWAADLQNCNVVFIYQLPDYMKRLEEKLTRELPIGARVVSHAFPFPTWEPTSKIGNLFLYIKK